MGPLFAREFARDQQLCRIGEKYGADAFSGAAAIMLLMRNG